jgi:hypothetical protein
MAWPWKSLTGLDLPDGVPPCLAICFAITHHTETEARQVMVEGGNVARADEWIAKFRSAGYFEFNPPPPTGTSGLATIAPSLDGGTYLWTELKRQLTADETDFKHRMAVLDKTVKMAGGAYSSELHILNEDEANGIFPLSMIADLYPWHGCKFVSTVVLHLLSKTDARSKQDAVRPVCRSLGGCIIPPKDELSATRWPFVLSEAYPKASLAARNDGICTALHIQVNDVEVMNNPAKKGNTFRSRPGTFAHSCVITISPDGVYLFQSYGPRGYTLLQHMQEHSESGPGVTYPLSLEAGEAWVARFEEFAATLGGVWTKAVNEAYLHCFGVDLVALGSMRIGSQMDQYIQLYSFEFDGSLVQKNFALLPRPRSSPCAPCKDGADTKSKKAHPGYIPDGGVKHYYVPLIVRCGNCGTNNGENKRCVICKTVHYCSRECQKKDWVLRHKKVCKTLVSSA